MSTTAHAPGVDAGHAHDVRSEDDRIESRAIVVVGVASLVLFFLAGLVAVTFFFRTMAERGPIAIPPDVGQSKIGLVEQQQFGLVVRGERAREKALQRLQSYGWVDKQAGVAHIPIEEAMRLVAGGARPAPVKGDSSKSPGAQP